MAKLLGFVLGKLTGVLQRNNPESGKLFQAINDVNSIAGIAQDFKTNGWSLRNVGSQFFGGD